MYETNTDLKELWPRITVIGVGGAGNNAVATMIEKGLRGVELVAANTDAQALRSSAAARTLQLGRGTTAGLGAGSCAALGRAAAEESRADIEQCLASSDMCFIAAGMGGGTGSGAAPVVAGIARKLGILTVAVVTKPFAFEGARRNRAADKALEELAAQVDSLIVIPNQNLFRVIGTNTSLKSAFALADDILFQGVRGISDLMVVPGLINLDFADVRTILANTGRAKIGTGEASGDDRAQRAALQALTDPLLDEEIGGANGLLVSICGGDDMLLWEVDEAARQITELVHADADIIWGSSNDPGLEGRIRVSIVAAGIERRSSLAAAQPLRDGGAASTAPPRLSEPGAGAAPAIAASPVACLPSPASDRAADNDEDAPWHAAPAADAPEVASEPAAAPAGPPPPRPLSLFERMAGAAARGAPGREAVPDHAPRRLVVHDQRAA